MFLELKEIRYLLNCYYLTSLFSDLSQSLADVEVSKNVFTMFFLNPAFHEEFTLRYLKKEKKPLVPEFVTNKLRFSFRRLS